MTWSEVSFVDTELAVISFLRPLFPGVYMDRRVPATRRDEMVIVRGDGGPQLSVVSEMQRVGLSVWALTDQRAGALARDVQAKFVRASGNKPFISVTKTGGPYAVDDPSNQPLRYSTYEVLLRGAPA